MWKDDTLEEYWKGTLAAVVWSDNDWKGHGPDVIVDDGGGTCPC